MATAETRQPNMTEMICFIHYTVERRRKRNTYFNQLGSWARRIYCSPV